MKKHTVELSDYQISILIEALDDYIDYWQERIGEGADVNERFMDTTMMLESFFKKKLRNSLDIKSLRR